MLRVMLVICGLSAIASAPMSAAADRTRESFNADWLFHRGDVPEGQQPDLNDDAWRKLRLPHDWAIEGPFKEEYGGRMGGLPSFGVSWYRKTFTLPENSAGKNIAIEFDGAMYDSEVWINGHFLGRRAFGYIGFSYDLTPYLRPPGEENVIAVKLSPEELSSRWYPGAGIYRNTWLTITDPIHVAHWGTYITTPEVSDQKATVAIETKVRNATKEPADLVIVTEILNPAGKSVAHSESPLKVPAGEILPVKQTINVKNPERWDLETPSLYVARTKVMKGGEEIDTHDTRFGIRTISYDANQGFSLNGRRVQFAGVCMHHDLGALGAAMNTRALQRQLEIMKEMGANAIRTSHNPPAPELLQLCDEMGLLVQVEAFDMWEMPKVENGYSKFFKEWHERDLRDMIKRDRNHPSVVMWSIGNEILEQGHKTEGARIATELTAICHDEDPTRPVTAGFNMHQGAMENGVAAAIDLVGFNYKPMYYKKYLEENPNWIFYGAETSSCTSTRGFYEFPIKPFEKNPEKQVSSFDYVGPVWAYPPEYEFDAIAANPRIMGEFIWTGIDYLGEPTPYAGRDNLDGGAWKADWPSRSSYFAPVDLAGFPKDRFYLYQAQWTDRDVLHLLPHWNWEGREGESVPVTAYTNLDEVELFLNGKSLGKKVRGKDTTTVLLSNNQDKTPTMESKLRLRWEVPYEPGTLRAVGYKDGKQVAEKTIVTAGQPAKIRASADRSTISADGDDLAFVTLDILDEKGNFAPLATNGMTFSVEGPGELIAVDNGDPTSTDSFQANTRKAFFGKALAIVRSKNGAPGEIVLTATSEGLKPASVSITSKPSK